MDLGIYNINFTLGLFGEPKKVNYFPNIKKKIDTSGVLVLDYGTFKVNAVCAKDCQGPLLISIQGDKAQILSNDASSMISAFSLIQNDGSTKEYSLNSVLCHVCELSYSFYRIFRGSGKQKFIIFSLITIDLRSKSTLYI